MDVIVNDRDEIPNLEHTTRPAEQTYSRCASGSIPLLKRARL